MATDTIRHGGHVEDAVLDWIRTWLPTFLGLIEQQDGLAARTLPRPRSWTTVAGSKVVIPPAAQLPAVVVTAPGLAGRPTRRGDGSYSAPVGFGVAGIVSAGGADPQRNTNLLAKRYAAALRTLIVRKPSLGGIASGLEYVDEAYDELPPEETSTLAFGRATFVVQIDDWIGGAVRVPATPAEDPYLPPAPLPTVRQGGASTDVELVAP